MEEVGASQADKMDVRGRGGDGWRVSAARSVGVDVDEQERENVGVEGCRMEEGIVIRGEMRAVPEID